MKFPTILAIIDTIYFTRIPNGGGKISVVVPSGFNFLKKGVQLLKCQLRPY